MDKRTYTIFVLRFSSSDLSVFQLSEEEKKRIYEPLVIVDQNTKDAPDSDNNQSDAVSPTRKAPVASDQRDEEEEEQ